MHKSSVNLPPFGASTELFSCATRLKFKYLAVTVFGTLLALTLWKSYGLEWSNSSPKKAGFQALALVQGGVQC